MNHFLSFSCRLLLICFSVLMLPILSYAVNVKDFGAKGDGKTDDTGAINAAITGAKDGLVEFPRGTYRITKTIEIDLSQHGTLGLSGRGASAGIIMTGEGPAFRFIGSHDKGSALPSSVKPLTWEKERMPLIDALEIVGDHANADGIEIRNTFMPTLRALLIRNVRNGIHLTSRNRNVLIDACQIKNPLLNGIQIESSANLRVVNCTITERAKNKVMLAGIVLKGACPGTVIKDNSVGRGKEGDISNQATGAFVGENTYIQAAQ